MILAGHLRCLLQLCFYLSFVHKMPFTSLLSHAVEAETPEIVESRFGTAGYTLVYRKMVIIGGLNDLSSL